VGYRGSGDWSLYHGAALDIHGAKNVAVDNCAFVRLDNNAIILTGYTRNVSIVNNTAAWLGMNFAAAWGDTDGVDATNGNQPRGTLLTGNLVGELGIWEKQSSFWFQAKACLSTIADNVIFNLPRAAINFNVRNRSALICRPPALAPFASLADHLRRHRTCLAAGIS
jgi:hypothetical protein